MAKIVGKGDEAMLGKLNVSKLKKLSKPGRYGDGGGLYFNIAKGGSQSWVQIITIDGVRRYMGLGAYPVVSLNEARESSFEIRRKVAKGESPIDEKVRAKIPTFRVAAQKTLDAISSNWKSKESGRKRWMGRMEHDVFPIIGDMPVNRVRRDDVLRVLKPIWTTKSETARKVKQYMNSVFVWCLDHNYIKENPVGDFQVALPRNAGEKKNYKSLPYQEVPGAIELIRASKASIAAKLCLEFVILTACRSGEARSACWDEVNLETRTWEIPASRTKTSKEHRQPLSEQAVDILEQAKEIADGSDLIFPSPLKRGEALSTVPLMNILKTSGLRDKCVVHGFRTSFRTWASENTSADHAVMELCLGHSVGSAVERAYARSDLFEKRARLMEQWGAFACRVEPGKVIKLRTG